MPPLPTRTDQTRTSTEQAPDDRVSRVAAVLLVAGFVMFFPGGLYRFMLPKLLVVAAGILAAAWAAPAGRLPRKVVRVVVGCAGALALAALVSPAPWAQLVGRWPRYEGLVALTAYAGALWAGARLWGPGASAQRRGWALATASWASIVLAVVAVAEAAGLRPLGGDVARPGALLGNASDQGIVGAVLLGLLLAHVSWTRTRRAGGDGSDCLEEPAAEGGGQDPTETTRELSPTMSRAMTWLLGAGVVAAAATTVTSGSRGAFGAALVAVVVCGWAHLRATRNVRGIIVPAAVGLALVAGALAAPGGIADRLEATDAIASSSAQGRWTMVGTAVDMVASRPVTGAGPSGFVDQAPAHLPATWWATEDPTMTVDSPHSVFLQVVVAGGALLALGALA
ncbi:MAG: O-antigen ligase family protein, partial [Micrococcales bacterium]|nr:O-antigen ligase family protein [Micrococcales bacterium]